MSEPTCKNCKYMRFGKTGDYECHYNPPVGFHDEHEIIAMWPAMTYKNWCGKHEWPEVQEVKK